MMRSASISTVFVGSGGRAAIGSALVFLKEIILCTREMRPPAPPCVQSNLIVVWFGNFGLWCCLRLRLVS